MMKRVSWMFSLALACGGGSGETTTDTGTGTSTSTDATATEATGSDTTTTTGTSDTPTSTAPTSTADPTTGEPPTTGTTTTTTDPTGTSTTGAVDPPMSLADIVDGELELIADGHMFTEGPIWSPEGYLLYSDIPANTIFRWAEGEQPIAFITPSGNSNGLAFDAMGRLVAGEHGGRRISRRTIGDPDAETIVGEFEGQSLNSPNDLTIRSDGTIYFTDPPYGIQPNQQELDFQGVFRVDPQGQVSLVADDFDRPNGIVLSPDESLLYVADTNGEHVRVFTVEPDGNAVGGEVFVALQSDLPGDPDGMAVDAFGDLYVSGGGGVRVVTPDATVLGTIEVPEQVTNCKFGDPDGKALFITAQARVYRIRLKVAGA
ncbi:SMP-30/gluconolactonase/LRE family protein [Nannocystis sp. SCPEA4]|uniref:SMP-30/gluconolactonase/LRE family protein n=1 Tax=Nannocystis sp. SCPEA4 TaxID=2996787 RepID=UPI002270C4B5|nr:SMP-30/gluconolactonase/LRE family protein [Nannocystis sp. SCPEA4]MCY1054813.1 SMP-30/gluconolactonase/LRE family protein [Nannocystis sp. SCPEA4]